MEIEISKLIEGKQTYPSWATNSIHNLQSHEDKEGVLVYYRTKSNKLISRFFPNKVNLTPRLIYVLGLLKGEGSNSIGDSNYRRFTMTNSDPAIIKIVLNELDKHNLFKKSKLIDKSIHLLHHTKSNKEVISYWSKKLGLNKSKFKCFNSKKTTPFGVCHVYISDVLLRRVVDLIHEKIMD
ncbi:MAG: hypothetical protein KKG75_04260 [Nanoarchaeota archaeon]|nr:hypothetical protein [Nanoarchaeota archaeon]